MFMWPRLRWPGPVAKLTKARTGRDTFYGRMRTNIFIIDRFHNSTDIFVAGNCIERKKSIRPLLIRVLNIYRFRDWQVLKFETVRLFFFTRNWNTNEPFCRLRFSIIRLYYSNTQPIVIIVDRLAKKHHQFLSVTYRFSSINSQQPCSLLVLHHT